MLSQLSATIALFSLYFCLHLTFVRSFTYEHCRMNDEHQATNKPEVFDPVGENSVAALEMLQQV